jgi:hypothetical protein
MLRKKKKKKILNTGQSNLPYKNLRSTIFYSSSYFPLPSWFDILLQLEKIIILFEDSSICLKLASYAICSLI